MKTKKYFAIGDIHGCLKPLRDLIAILPITPADELVFLGDYIDRGPDSKAVIDYLIELAKVFPTTFLRGNHEQMYLDASSPDFDNTQHWMANGGRETLACYKDGIIPEEHVCFINKTTLYYETLDYLFVHAGYHPGKSMSKDYMLWVREDFIDDQTPWSKKVIFGHTPQHRPLVMENKIGIDTGCVFGNALTCVELTSGKEPIFHQAHGYKGGRG